MNLLIYSILLALVCGVFAGTASALAFRSKFASYFLAALGAAILAILANIGMLYAMATFYPDASVDGSAIARAAGRSFWVAILISVVAVASMRRRKSNP